MKKISKTLNKYGRSHKNLRKFLRLVSYGCYSRNLFERHEITPRSYDDFLRQMRFFIPSENIRITWHNKFAYVTFAGDSKSDDDNFLYKSFLLKTILPEHCLYDITILQITEREQKNFSLQEVVEKIYPEIPTSDADLVQSIRRRLNELTDSGLLKRCSKKNKFLYAKILNPLGELDEEEIKILKTAVNFYKNFSMIETAGYFLFDSLKNLYPTSDLPKIFRFKNNNFVRILDDDILLTVVNALNAKKKILVKRENKPAIIILPLSVETDFVTGRQYVVALKEKEIVRLRVDKIVEAEISNENFSEINLPVKKKLRPINLRVCFKNRAERFEREKILRDEPNFKILTEGENFFDCAIETEDPLQYYPRLWNFQTWAEILPGADGLRERMKKDAEEVLKNYADAF